MTEKDKIYEDISGSGKGFSKEEQELFKQLLEFEKQEGELLPEQGANIIKFFQLERDDSNKPKVPVKFAADSSFTKLEKRSDFLLSSDGLFALKISKKVKEEIHLTLLSESEMTAEDAILYSPVLNKYFVSNAKGDFVIGQYAGVELKELGFRAILPFEKIKILKADNYSVFSLTGKIEYHIDSVTSSTLNIKINTDKIISSIVLSSAVSKDFLKIVNGIIEIPIVLLSNKSEILLY